MKRSLRVAVSGLHLGENAQPGPGVARSLREALGSAVEIIGLAYDAFDSALHAPGLLDDAFMVPYPSAGPEAVLKRLLIIHREQPLDVIIPCLDVELPVLASIATHLRAAGIKVLLPEMSALERRSKDQLPRLAAGLGVATPETITIGSGGELAAAGATLGYPFVIKGLFYEAEVVHGPGEAASAFAKLAGRWGLPLIAQRFIAGDEYDVIALGDGNGGVHGAVAMRKTIVTRMGKAWGAVTVKDEALTTLATRVVSGLRWRGGCEVELLRSARDGRVYLIEVNPRFPAWVYLATAAGVNLPLGALRLALGEPLPAYPAYEVGVFYVRHATEALGNLQDMESLHAHGRAHRRPSPALPAPRPHAPLAHPLPAHPAPHPLEVTRD